MTRGEYWREKREVEHYMKAEEQEMKKEFEFDATDLFLDLCGVLIMIVMLVIFCLGTYHFVKMIIG